MMKDGYYRFKCERSITKSIAQHIKGRWFLIGEADPVSLDEINRRGWELDGIVENMEIDDGDADYPRSDSSNYFGFYDWNDVQSRFAMKMPEPNEVLHAEYDNSGYAGSALVVYRNGYNYYIVEGSHCSCYGLEGQWDAEEFHREDFEKYLRRRIKSEWSDSRKKLWKRIIKMMEENV